MKLNDWLATRETEISNSEFAERIGVSRQAVWRYRLGERMPRPDVISRIREATRGAVTANDFVSEHAA